MLFPELKGNPGFNVVHGVSMRHQRFISIRLSGPHMTCSMSRLLTTTFTTADFVRSSLRLFEAFSYKTAPKGPPSSFIQHNAQRVFLTQPFTPAACNPHTNKNDTVPGLRADMHPARALSRRAHTQASAALTREGGSWSAALPPRRRSIRDK